MLKHVHRGLAPAEAVGLQEHRILGAVVHKHVRERHLESIEQALVCRCGLIGREHPWDDGNTVRHEHVVNGLACGKGSQGEKGVTSYRSRS